MIILLKRVRMCMLKAVIDGDIYEKVDFVLLSRMEALVLIRKLCLGMQFRND